MIDDGRMNEVEGVGFKKAENEGRGKLKQTQGESKQPMMPIIVGTGEDKKIKDEVKEKQIDISLRKEDGS